MITSSVYTLALLLTLSILAGWYLFVREGKPRAAAFLVTFTAAVAILAVCLCGYRTIKQHDAEQVTAGKMKGD